MNEKQNEPYVWEYVASSDGDGITNIAMPSDKWQELIRFVDAPQTKPLSDEEIKEIALKVGFLTEEDLTPEWSEYTQEFVGCVRAIEAKVRGEK